MVAVKTERQRSALPTKKSVNYRFEKEAEKLCRFKWDANNTELVQIIKLIISSERTVDYINANPKHYQPVLHQYVGNVVTRTVIVLSISYDGIQNLEVHST